MIEAIAGLALVERDERHGRVRLVLEDHANGFVVDACALTIDPLDLHDGGGGLVRVGGIGNVATLESHRRRGLASRLLEVAVARMRRDGMVASLLYGIDGFYDRLGWRSCGDERWAHIPIESLRDHDWMAGSLVRPMRPDDRPAVAALYERIAAGVPGAASRGGGRAWSQLREPEVLIVEVAGAVQGWAWRGCGDVPERDQLARLHPDAVAYAELHAVDAGSMLALLAGVGERERAEHPAAVELVTGACEESTLRRVSRAGCFTNSLVDETRPTGGAMLLELDQDGSRSIDGTLYQFLPDRF